MTSRSEGRRWRRIVVFSLVCLGCGSLPEGGGGRADGKADGVGVVGTDPIPVTTVTDPVTMAYLEAHGLSFAEVFSREGASQLRARLSERPMADARGDELDAHSAIYRSLVSFVRSDARATEERHRGDGREVGYASSTHTAMGRGYQRVVFHPDWLRSHDLFFELVAVVNRFDRRLVPARADSCGEVRLVYRPAYHGPMEYSRLPFSILLVFPQSSSVCVSAGAQWLRNPSNLGGDSLGDWLLEGPLHDLGAPVSVETNVQIAVWSRFAKLQSVGRSHEYAMRVYEPTYDADRSYLSPSPLENTPDVTALVGDPERIEQLRSWIRDNLEEIDRGTAMLPEEFLATVARSFSARGLARPANRPYSLLFGFQSRGFQDLPYEQMQEVRSEAALFRRLDTMSCQGCHQARSISGFHLLGVARDPSAVINAVAVGESPHLLDEGARRSADLLGYLQDPESDPYTPMPLVERGFSGHRGMGAPCGLGQPGFEDMTCDYGVCEPIDGSELGHCVTDGAPAVGDRCETESYSPFAWPISRFENVDEDNVELLSHYDTAEVLGQMTCASYAGCSARENGFPLGGSCLGGCAEYGAIMSETTICAPVPLDVAFAECWGRIALEDCVTQTMMPLTLRLCDRDNPCRDEFLCAQVPGREPSVGGACVPGYLMNQLEVDTHRLRLPEDHSP